jgi:hypothetical protein
MPIEFRDNVMHNIMVIEKESQKAQPAIVSDKNIPADNGLSASDSLGSDGTNFLVDGKMDDFQEYPVNGNGDEQDVTINISPEKSLTTSRLNLYLDQFVSLPKSVEIAAAVNGEEKIVLAKRNMAGSMINFPKTTAQKFKITFTYVQPLRIRELSFGRENQNMIRESSVRFLAQPDKKYEVYFNADRYADVNSGEMPDLRDNRDVMPVKKAVPSDNVSFRKSDVDGDGIPDETDNCVTAKNADQEDVNNNGRGDACDDFDRDGIINSKDNCRDTPNRDQKDTDLDGIGNVCDGKESRILQNQKWLPLAVILLAAGIVGIFFVKTMKTKE